MNQHFVAHPNVYEMQTLQNYFTELEGTIWFEIIILIKLWAMSYYLLEGILLETINNKISTSSN